MSKKSTTVKKRPEKAARRKSTPRTSDPDAVRKEHRLRAERDASGFDADAQERLVKINHNVPGDFPQTVLEEAATLPDAPTEQEINEAGRRDLRAVPFVSIDGADARDFDDAIHVERAENGWLLRVAIADVAHYVRPGSELDREARIRANSWYFPRSVEPMLPEALSNGLCSLKPGKPRLAMVAEMAFDEHGERTQSRFFSACIQSRARLVYEEVSRAFPEPHAAMLEAALELADTLKKRRTARGALDFNVPEAQAIFSENGTLADLAAREIGVSNGMIEEFMLAANEAVAHFLHELGLPALYRVHPDPDPEKLAGLFATLAATGLAEPIKRPGPSALRRLLNAKRDDPRGAIIRRLALRTMMQARYSAEQAPHFGLAADYYCHFTSPIRRYADLTVHRSLRHALGLPTYGKLAGVGRLEYIAQGLNERERAAIQAEREILRSLGVLLLHDRIGEVLDGVIGGLTDFGFFVECAKPMVEGMVRLSSLSGDYYHYNPVRQELLGERTGKRFHLGQIVRVAVRDVSMARLEIDFTLLAGEKNEGDYERRQHRRFQKVRKNHQPRHARRRA